MRDKMLGKKLKQVNVLFTSESREPLALLLGA
jgi:hypothetical protein